MNFIQIERIVVDKEGKQKVVPETVNVSEIHSFRSWKKGVNDTFEKEDVTLLIMKTIGRATGRPADKNVDNLPTMLIHEGYHNFLKRMSGNVILVGNAQ